MSSSGRGDPTRSSRSPSAVGVVTMPRNSPRRRSRGRMPIEDPEKRPEKRREYLRNWHAANREKSRGASRKGARPGTLEMIGLRLQVLLVTRSKPYPLKSIPSSLRLSRSPPGANLSLL